MPTRLLLSLALLGLFPPALRSEEAPHIRLVPLASKLDKPVACEDDGTGRLFIVQQDGSIVIFHDGQVDRAPFLDIRDRVVRPGNECGLLGLAFHPDFANNRRFFVNYDAKVNGQLMTRISEFRADAGGRTADPASEKILLTYNQPFTNHKGGQLLFAPDGKLYIGAGDGGAGGDPYQNGQNLGALLGKVMRIDVDGGTPYAVPKDNPFVGQAGARPEIWCYGMRNPWRFSVDHQTGQIWCGDVGQDKWEEVDILERGKNYGWSAREGKHDFKPERAIGSAAVDPVKDYPHSEGNCIIGGYVYRGKAIPALHGMYVYGDYTRGWIAGLRYDGRQLTFDAHLMETPVHISSFGEDRSGELYICDRDTGNVFMIGP